MAESTDESTDVIRPNRLTLPWKPWKPLKAREQQVSPDSTIATAAAPPVAAPEAAPVTDGVPATQEAAPAAVGAAAAVADTPAVTAADIAPLGTSEVNPDVLPGNQPLSTPTEVISLPPADTVTSLPEAVLTPTDPTRSVGLIRRGLHAGPLADVVKAFAAAHTPAGEVPALTVPATLAPTTLHADGPASTTVGQAIAAALATLPTLPTIADTTSDPIAELTAQVTLCACKAINQVLNVVATVGKAVAEFLMPIVADDPNDPSESPILSAVLAWVRRQSDAITSIPPIASAIATINSLSAQLLTEIVSCGQPATGLPEDFERTVVLTGLNEPTDFRFLPDGRILVAEKTGAIKIYQNSSTASEPITLIVLPTQSESEKGLTGIELDPNLTVESDGHINGYIYVAYTGADNHDRLSRLTIEESTVVAGSEVEIMVSPEEAGLAHHGGEIHFGKDGMLYWATGDNSLNTNAQDLTNIHGKIMRIDPTTLKAPLDNPFIGVVVNGKPAVPEIYAYGLRNPFRFTFTPDGDLLVGDVGNASWEELNVVKAGANYGWPNQEGVCQGCQYVNPIYAYPHVAEQSNAGSITAVLVYDATGPGFPDSYQNKVFIADYTLGWIKVLTFDDEFTSLISEETFDSDAGTTVKLIQGPDGNIYQLNIYPGELLRIAPSDGNRAPTAVITSSQTNGLSPLVVNFSGSQSSDPDSSDTLTYAWDFGDGTTSTEANPTKTYTAAAGTVQKYNVTLTVSDGEKTGTTTQQVTVGSTAPVAHIIPLANSKYNAGDTITFSGTGTDAEDDANGVPLDYKWTVVFHHNTHVHPFEDNITGTTGSVTIPRDPSNVATTWYRITLTVTDSSGLSSTDYIDVKPNLVDLTFNASDPNATYTIDGIPHKGTYSETGVVGVERVISAPSQGQYVFSNWSDGGAQTHTITTPATATSYLATYTVVPVGSATSSAEIAATV